MTIIAYRDGIIAADTAVWRGDFITGFMRKITRFPDGSLAAAAGCAYITQWFLDQVAAGADLVNPPDDEEGSGFQFIIVRLDGKVFRGGRSMAMMPITADWHAIGLSSMFATGAMAAGASAVKAVNLTIKWAAWSGGDVQVERIGVRP